MSTAPIDLARTYFDAWAKRDFEALRGILADDVTFQGPLGRAANADECVNGIRGMSEMTKDVVICKMVADDTDVITWFDLYTTVTPNPISVANWSHVESGKITEIKATFDPRTLTKS